MALNQKAVDHAKQLIEEGKYEPGDKDWSDHQPTSEDENQYLEDHSWDEYSKWFLSIEEDGDKDEKETYGFPYGNFQKVHRGGLIAAKQRAAQHDHPEVEKAADELMEMIEEKENG